MTESTIPFAGQQGADQEPALAPLEEPTGGRGKLLALAGVAAVVLAAVAAYFLLFAGGAEEEPSGGSKPAAAPVPAASPAAPAAVPAQRLNAKSFGRDPFKALIVEAPEEAPEVAAPVVNPVPVAPSTSGGGTPATSGGTTGTTGGVTSPTPTSPHSFRVLSVAPDNSTITVKVDGVRYANLHAGEIFASFFKVRLISGASNSFQYGEERFNVLGNKRLTIA